MTQTVRILVIDDHPVVGEGIARLTAGTEIELLGCVPAIPDAERFARRDPQVVLLDLRLGAMVSAAEVRALRRILPRAQVTIFTAYPHHVAVAQALEGGAVGCLVKDIGQTDLIAALRALARGERLAGPATRFTDPFGLSRQERTILYHVARGNTNAEIGRAMYLAPNTVKTYWQAALAKLGARNRAEAIMRAHDAGVL